jgi:Na+-transporting methylmalonyl-CoA/oxaloacetate decarboxylase gamma subunit
MTEPDLLVVSITAFFAVMILLSLLAGMIRLLMVLFPHREEEPAPARAAAAVRGPDAAVLAAIHTAAAAAYPDMNVTRIEEAR